MKNELKLSLIAQNVSSSLTRQFFNMAKEISDTIDFTLGDPDLKPLESIRAAACDCINRGNIRYSANAGLLELRLKIAKDVNDKYNSNIDFENVIVTVGGMEALYLSLLSIINPGDEVLLLGPYYVNYLEMIKMCGGNPRIIWTEEDNHFEPSIEELNQAINSKTKAIIINNPNNPTGHVYNRKFLKEILQIVSENHLYLLSDEVYKEIIYSDEKFYSPFDGTKDNVILIDSFSKRHSMTGWRIGYAVGAKYIIQAMTKLQENVAACTPVISQYAAIEALNHLFPEENLREYRKRISEALEILKTCDKIHAYIPQGTFYIFVNIKKTGMKSLSFAENLLLKKHVAVAPGLAYGANYDNYIRISLTLPLEKIKEGMNKMVEFIMEL